MESPNTTLYRTFLLVSIPVLVLLWMLTGLHAYGALAGMLVLLLAIAFAVSRLNLRALRVTRRIFPSAYEGDTVEVSLLLENLRPRAAMLVELHDRFGPGIADKQIITEPGPVAGRSIRAIDYIGYCSRHWGVYTVGPIEILTADPAGLFHARRPFPEVETFSVFPRVHEVAGVKKLGARPSLTPQEATAGRSGQSLLYLGVREFRSGDEPRRVHWPATARRGTLMAKEFEVDLVPYFTLFLDLDRAHRAGTGRKSTMEYVVRTGASLLWTAARQGHFVQLFADGGRPIAAPPGRGEEHLTYVLHELIQTRQQGTVPLEVVAARSIAHLPSGSTAAFLYGTSTPETGPIREMLRHLRARGVRPAFVFVNHHSFVPVEHWPKPREEVVERQRELSYFLRSHGAPVAFLDATDDLEKRLADPDFLE
ncbi:MAG: DUF58 domain-containing protein [Planctomycetota bacterium]|jgi:uncharacterized protein (DUF58 family)